MLRITLLFAFIGLSTHLVAQKYDAPFGKMSDAELLKALQMKSYSGDSTVEAIILYDKGTIDRTYERTHITYLRRVKIFKNSATNTWGNMSRYVDTRGTRKIRGNCYTLVNGKIVKQELSDDNIFKSRHRSGIDEIKTAMPGVVTGSIVEYEFEINLTKFYTYPGWTFQYKVPVLMSEYFVSGAFSFQSDVGGFKKPKYSFNKWTSTHHWLLVNSPAFHTEPLMPDQNLYRTSLNSFYLTDPWTEQIPRLWKWKGFGTVIEGDPKLTLPWNLIVADTMEPKAKIKKIVEFVKEQMVWDGSDDIEAPYLDDALRNRKGSSSELNLYLISLLNKADLAVKPVLISTRDNGAYHEHFSTLEQFNYVIGLVAIGKDTIYVDATDRALPYNVLPQRCWNNRGMVVLKNDVNWINILPRTRDKLITESTLNIDNDGSLSGKISKKAEGYKALLWRKVYTHDPRAFTTSLADKNWSVQEFETLNAENIELPIVVNYQVTTNHQSTVAGSMLYISPFVTSDTTDVFKTETRTYPIDFVVPQEQVFIFNLNLPDGYVVDQLPESKVISMPGNAARAILNFSGTQKQVQVLSRVMINRSYFAAEEFKGLKDFYQRVAAKQSEQIVLKRN